MKDGNLFLLSFPPVPPVLFPPPRTRSQPPSLPQCSVELPEEAARREGAKLYTAPIPILPDKTGHKTAHSSLSPCVSGRGQMLPPLPAAPGSLPLSPRVEGL